MDRVADRGAAVSFDLKHNKLWIRMATNEQAERVFRRTDDKWIMGQSFHLRCGVLRDSPPH